MDASNSSELKPASSRLVVRAKALAARGLAADDPRTAAWEQSFVQATAHLRDDAGLQFLGSYVLPPGDWSCLLALKPSWSALRLLDTWLPTRFAHLLKEAVSIPYAPTIPKRVPFKGAATEFPLLSLLSEPHPSSDQGGVQVLKALLLAAIFRGTVLTTSRLVVDCANGLRKALSLADWVSLAPWSRIGYGLNLRDSVASAKAVVAGRPVARQEDRQHEFLSALAELLAALDTSGPSAPFTRFRLGEASVDADGEPAVGRTVLQFTAPVPRKPPDRAPPAGTLTTDAGEAAEPTTVAEADKDSKELGGETEEAAEFRASRTGFRSALANQWLAIDNDQLLRHELLALVADLQRDLASPQFLTRQTAAFIALSLFTGCTIEELGDSVVAPLVTPGLSREGQWIRVIRAEPDARTPTDSQFELLAPHGDRLLLALPTDVEAYFAQALEEASAGIRVAAALGQSTEALVQHARNWLEEFRRKHPRVLLGKVSRWLPTALYAASHDHVAVHLLTAMDNDPPCPGAYYRAPRAADLQKLHRDLVAATWPGTVSEPRAPGFRLGSWWFPAPSTLEELYARSREALENIFNDPSRPLPQRHNAHQVLSVLNLLLATACRPVEDIGESVTLFDRERRLAFVDDKSGGPARSHRIIPLAQLVADQIDHQQEHARRLAADLAPSRPAVARAIAAMLEFPERRIAPLFFWITDRYQIRSLAPGDVLGLLKEKWTLPLNFARHWLSTALREAGIDDAVIASFLGHVSFGTQSLSAIAPEAAQGHYTGVRLAIERLLREVGVRPVETFLDKDPASSIPPFSVSELDTVRPLFAFGYERRAHEREVEEETYQAEVRAFLTEQLGTKKIEDFSRKDVESLFNKVWELTPNANTYRAFRHRQLLRDQLLAAAKDHKKDWVLPSVEAVLRDYQIVVERDAFLASRRVQLLRDALRSALHPDGSRRRGTAGGALHPTSLAALALACECLVLDEAVIIAWAAAPQHDVIQVKGAGKPGETIDHWVELPVDRVGTRLYPVPRWLVPAIAGIESAARFRCTKERLDRDVAQFAASHGLEWLSGGFSQVVRLATSAASLEISGIALAFATGAHGSVSLPASAIERLVQGTVSKAPRRSRAEVDEEAPAPPEVVAVEGISHKNIGADLAGVSAFFEMVRECFAGGRKLSITKDTDAEMAYPKMRVDRLGVLLEKKFDELQAHQPLPPVCGELANWLLSMVKTGRLRKGRGKKGNFYALRSLGTYWSNLSRRLVEQVGAEDISKMEAAEIEETYHGLIEFSPTARRRDTFIALRVFHDYLKKRRGVPQITWRPIAALANTGRGRVDANLVLESEYLEALRLLAEDPSADNRQRALQSAVLVLCFRAGLRIEEAWGLRRKDVTHIGGVWVVRVSVNLYRGTKSAETSIRLIPILEKLTDLEQTVLERWTAHVDEYIAGQTTTGLFTKTAGSRALFPRTRLSERLRQALWAATGDETIRVHHCRHGLPNRLIAAALNCADEGNIHLRALMNKWPASDALLSTITQEDRPTRRLIWALSRIMGHTTETLLRSYFHIGGELLAREVRRTWWARNAQDTSSDPKSTSEDTIPASVRPLEFKERPASTTGSTLPVLEEGEITLQAVDRVINLLGSHARVDGVADAVLLAEHQVEQIARAADEVVQMTRGAMAERSGRWFIDSENGYSYEQEQQVDHALRRLEKRMGPGIQATLEELAESIDERQNLLMVQDLDQVRAFAELMKLLVDDPGNVELVLPEAPLRPPPREGSGEMAPRKRGRPPAGTALRSLALGDEVWKPWQELAAKLKISVHRRSHLAGSRDGGANRKIRQVRAGLRIRRNGDDVLHDSRVGARVVASAAVWHLLQKSASRG